MRKAKRREITLQSIKDTKESYQNTEAIADGVKKAVERAIRDTNVKVPK